MEAINIDTVLVGDAGNSGEVQSQGAFGAVSYDYHIGTYEVTNSQYTAFLNAVAATGDTHNLYNSSMSITNTSGTYSTSEPDKPVSYVSFWDAARFANWLTNGQPTGTQGPGTTEDGMYNLGGVTNPTNSSVSRQLDFSSGQNGVAIASENEWYKAAYYDPTLSSGSGGYYEFPTQSDTAPTDVAPWSATGSNNANYNKAVGAVTDVGAYTNSASHYGTFDQGGNVWEWNDAIVNAADQRGLRGASFNGFSFTLKSSRRENAIPTYVKDPIGFRVTSLAPIPEPSAYAAILGMLGLTLALMRRKGRGTL